jgi:hypothetical protein
METVYKVVQKDITLDKFDDVITINPFGDVHRDSASCDVDRWRWWLTRMKKQHGKFTYYLGMGDYHDFASTSEKAILNNPKLHDDTKLQFDLTAEKKNRVFARELSFMGDNIIGFIEGNHSWSFLDGKTSTTDLAERLNTLNLGWLCHLTLKIACKYANSTRNIATIHIVACHGRAGGKTHGVTINQVGDLKAIFPLADIYIMGHDHQRGAWPTSVLYPVYDTKGNTYIKQKRQFLARSGAFLKGYCDGKSTYGVGSLYKPSDLGAIQFKVGFHEDRSMQERIIVDIKAEI